MKVEEKKLQQEQETNALSTAAVLVTMLTPATTESIPGLNVSVDNLPGQSSDQSALTIDSAQSANVSPEQGTSLNGKTTAPKMQINSSVPNFETAKTAATQPQKVNGQTSISNLSAEPQTKGQTVSPANGTQQGVTELTSSNSPVSTTITNNTGIPSEKNNVKTTIHTAENIATPKPSSLKTNDTPIAASETNTTKTQQTPQPTLNAAVQPETLATVRAASETIGSSKETQTKNIPQADIPAAITVEIPQPAKVASTPIMTSATIDVSNETIQVEAKSTAPAQADIPPREIPQPTKVVSIPTMKSATTDISNESAPVEAKSTMPAQVDISTREIPQSAKVVTEKSTTNEVSNESIPVEAKPTTPAQVDMSAREVSQPAKVDLKSATTDVNNKSVSAETKSTAPAQADIPTREVSQPAKVVTEKSTTAKVSNESVQAETKSTAPTQADTSAREIPQTAKVVSAPTMKSATTDISNESAPVEAKSTTPAQADIPAREIPQPVKVASENSATAEVSNEAIPVETKSTTPAQADISAREVSQPVNVVGAPAMKSATPEASNESVSVETKSTVPVQVDIPAREVSHPAKVVTVSTMKSETPEVRNESVSVEAKSSTPAQVDIPVREVSQSVEKVDARVDGEINTDKKVAALKTKDEAQATKLSARESVGNIEDTVVEKPLPVAESVDQNPAAQAAAQKEVSNSSPAPAPAMSSTDAKTLNLKAEAEVQAAPLTNPVSLAEADETILKNKDAKVATSLSTDSAAAESQPGNGIKPQVKNEAVGFAQENIPASVQSKSAAQSVGVEIRSEEKVSSKEPALDLESKVVISGADKGIIDVKAVEKSSVAKIDPTAMDVIEQITSQMKTRIKSGETSISMKLNPEKLGAIEVQMTHNAQGVSVSFITEQASTGQLIESQVNQLRQSLKEAGVQLTNLNISQQQANQQPSQQASQQGGGFKQGQSFVQTPRRDVSQTETIVEGRVRPQRIDGLTSEIDYLI